MTYEAYNLRNFHIEGVLAVELEYTSALLSKLESRGDEFSVYDIDDYGNYYQYRRQKRLNGTKAMSASDLKREDRARAMGMSYMKELSWSDKILEEIKEGPLAHKKTCSELRVF